MTDIATSQYQVEVFFDGACPLCRREVGALRWLDRRRQVCFTDISTADFDAARYGLTMEEFMARIYGRLPDGTWVDGVETFRRIYSALGLGWLVLPTRWPGISHGLDWAYRVFARNRLRLTGRCRDGACVSTTHRPVGKSRPDAESQG